jgi:DnaJ family protein C protein 28
MAWTWLAEHRIQAAIQEGLFDNLEGNGRPLKLESNPFVDSEWRLAYHVMQSAGIAPAWIELDGKIRTRIQLAREQLYLALNNNDESSLAMASAYEHFQVEIKAINRLVDELNIRVPADRFARCHFDVEREILKCQSRQRIK